MIHEYLHKRRLEIMKYHLGDEIADVDVGAGKSFKGRLSLDINADNAPDIVADLHHLPIKSSAASSIVYSHVIEHATDANIAASEARRILKQDGTAIFFLPDDGSKMWRLVEPLWTIYYKKFVSNEDSPESHNQSFTRTSFREFLDNYFPNPIVKKISLGMEIYAICRRN